MTGRSDTHQRGQASEEAVAMGSEMRERETYTVGSFTITRDTDKGHLPRYKAEHRATGIFCYGADPDPERAMEVALRRVREAIEDAPDAR